LLRFRGIWEDVHHEGIGRTNAGRGCHSLPVDITKPGVVHF
jgi:hypothetical protein